MEKVFKVWDEDGSGTIERSELEMVMHTLSPNWGAREIQRLMDQIDTNGDGHIDFAEFLHWLTDPTAAQTLHKDGWFGSFDFGSLMHQLFDVFDRDGSGQITVKEFNECYTILNASLRMHPDSRGTTLTEDLAAIFMEADGDGDSMVDFEEFKSWQSQVIKKSGIPNSMLPDIIEELSGALKIIFEIDEKTSRGEEQDGTLEALEQQIQQVALKTRDLYRNVTPAARHETPDLKQPEAFDEPDGKSQWCKPIPSVVCMNMLLRKCAMQLGISLSAGSGAKTRHLRGGKGRSAPSKKKSTCGPIRFCIPDLNSGVEPPSRWLAQAVRLNKTGEEEFFIFEIPASKLESTGTEDHWTLLQEGGAEEFKTALDALPSQIQLYSLLACQAWDKKLDWDLIQQVMKTAQTLGLLAPGVEETLRSHMRGMVRYNLGRSRIEELSEMGQEHVQEEIDTELNKMQLSAYQTLTALWDSGMRIPKPIWAQLQ